MVIACTPKHALARARTHTPGSVEAELPDEALEAVAGRRVEADLGAHALLWLLEPERELVVHLREVGEGPLHLHAKLLHQAQRCTAAKPKRHACRVMYHRTD